MSSEANRSLLSDYGLSALPGEWKCSVIGDLLKVDRGISVGVMYPGGNCPGGIPLIKAGDIRNNWINPKPDFSISTEKHQEYIRTELEGGELLISLVGNAGQTAVVPKEMRGWNTARAVAVLRLEEEVDPVYLQYCLQSPSIQALMKSWCNTTVQETLNLKEIKKVPFPLPGMNEQKAIAHILGTLDDKIELNRKSNETLEGIAKALYKSWFVDFDPVRAKAEGRPTGLPDEISELFPDSVEESELGEIPSGWKVDEIGNVVECVGGSTPSTKESEYWDEGVNYWATPKDLSDLSEPFLLDTAKKITDLGVTKISSGILPMGTVLLSSRAPVGYVAVAKVPVSVNQGFIAMKPSALLPTNFLLNWTLTNVQQFKDRASGTTFAEISKKAFRPVPVLLPRSGVVNAFTEIVEPLYENVVLNMKQSGSLTALRDALLPRLISGELRVPDAEKMIEEVGI